MSKVVIVGASGAIGQALCQHYLTAGQQVMALSRQPEPAALTKSAALHWQQLDEQEPSQLTSGLAHCFDPAPALVILCQGWLHGDTMQPEKAISQLSDSQWTQALAVNLLSPARYLQAMMPYLFRQQGIKVMVLSAKVGSISDNQLGGWYSYRVSKAALNMLVKTASIELKRRNKTAVLVTVHPGTTDSALSAPFQARLPARQLQTPASTATRLAAVAEGLAAEQSGLLLNWDGSVIPF